ncbi:histone-like nucleoid-structuring protein Lsr2 [Paenarthrobacter sp. PH39-S1]|uniref:histone-like nucleoid-structuring protein Lsr2 n=1 Tax=Micrococcaceae TaxID=1268 RepID=UPI0024BBB350|nr:Lsr2 family protein [Paenarthrobacter sp. PH39-S1]MDJ0354991.1 Lsr2 family protein [Paenarthrobacter sp. PH39-S1]
MAQKVEITLVDDIDEGHADETVRFALDGVSYEIDLSSAHAGELREALGAYTSNGRRVTGRVAKSRSTPAAKSQDVGQIRRWARENGYPVRERGRIQAEIQEAYFRANG